MLVIGPVNQEKKLVWPEGQYAGIGGSLLLPLVWTFVTDIIFANKLAHLSVYSTAGHM